MSSVRKDLVRIIRRSQTFISILLFVIVFLTCWKVTGFELTEIQLSKWGEGGKLAPLWNGIICLLSASIFWTSILYVKHNTRIKNKKIPYALFTFISICLLLVGIFNVNYKLIHNLSAYIYFFAYPLFIFITTYINRKYLQYKEWVNYNIISIGMILLPLICMLFFNGMAIAETVHTLFVVLWNLKISFKPN